MHRPAFSLLRDGVLGDIAQSARRLLHEPAFVIVSVLTLALAIGANTAIFTLVSAIWLRPLPVALPDRLAVVYAAPVERPGVQTAPIWDHSTWDQLHAVAAGTLTLAAVAAEGDQIVEGMAPQMRAPGGRPLVVCPVSSNYFQVLGVPIRGRGFARDDDRPDAPVVAVLSDEVWRTDFEADPTLPGRTVRFNGVPVVVAGIAPAGFRGPRLGDRTDVWLPLYAAGWFIPSIPHAVFLQAPQVLVPIRLYARLRSGVALAQAEAESRVLLSSKNAMPFLRTLADTAYPIRMQEKEGQDRRFTTLLAGTAFLLLVIGCANLAGLLLARSERRRPEVAVRLALGISRGRLVRLAATEASLLASAGAIGALLVSKVFVRTLAAFSLPTGIRIGSLDLDLDWRVAAFTTAVSLLTVLLCTLGPVLHAFRLDPARALAGRGSGPDQPPRVRGRALLLATHVALTMVLLVGTALFTASVHRALMKDLGFASDRSLFVLVAPNVAKYADAAFKDVDFVRRAADYDRLKRGLRSLAGVTGVAEGGTPLYAPMRAGERANLTTVSGDGRSASVRLASLGGGPDYCSTLGIPILAGRDLDLGDFSPDARPVVIVGEGLARTLWPGRSPLGRRLVTGNRGQESEVVGVAGDAVRRGIRGPTLLTIYRPSIRRADDLGSPFYGLVVRTAGPAAALVPAVSVLTRDVFADAWSLKVTTAGQEVAEQMMSERMGARLFAWFAAVAVALAGLGIWGLVAFVVASHNHENGVRLALGAPRGRLAVVTAWRGMAPAAAGCVIGLVIAAAATRLIAAYLYDVRALDPLLFAGCGALVIGFAALSALGPARRVLRVDPARVLRAE